ncbi:MAG: hypothetical protein COC19_02240 [SAR86 cluster bacterium]|uniref:Uncharacterized protein n=1 Tax=SAR86 cluster bacterium TaxID=2030880 RepID=A0A2A4MSN5_9GAMM|nr:MAG: hypothetical protein COC19_02240 [SAR86 cluster bacterium]
MLSALILLTACSGDSPSRSFETSYQAVYTGAFSPSGEYAIAGSFFHGGSLWRTNDAERLYNWNHKPQEQTPITATAFSPEGRYAVTADERTVVLWDVNTGRSLRYFNTPDDILSIKLSPRGEFALIGLSNQSAVFFDIQKGGILRVLFQGEDILTMDMSSDGRLALIGLGNNSKLWDLSTGTLLREIESFGRTKTVALSDDHRFAFIATSGQRDKAFIWDIQTNALHAKLSFGNPLISNFTSVLAAQFSSDSRRLITGSTVGSVILWDVDSGSEIQQWVTPKDNSLQPTSTAIVAVSRGPMENQYLAMSSNGKVYHLDY